MFHDRSAREAGVPWARAGAVTAPGGVGGCRILKGSSKVQHYNSVQKRPNKYGHYLDVIARGSRSNPTETDKGGHRKSPGGYEILLRIHSGDL